MMDRFEASSLHTMKVTMGEASLVLEKGGPAPSGAGVSSPEAPVQQERRETLEILAPLVGTYYAAAHPDEAPFVRVGDHVTKGQTVCLIEAMKMISEIPAPCDGIITHILKANGALVGFHEPLFQYTPC